MERIAEYSTPFKIGTLNEVKDKSYIEDKIITSDLSLKILTPLTCGLVNLCYNVQNIPNPEYFSLKDKGFVLLPRHHSYFDIPFENGFIKETMNRYPYHFMKASVGGQWLLRTLHGYPIPRLKDVRKHPDIFSRKDIVKTANYVYNKMIPYLLEHNKIVIIHPQGEREKNSEIKISNSILSSLLKSQEIVKEKIPFVALNISYENKGQFRPKVTLETSKPVYFGNNDREGLKQYILFAYK